MSSTVLDRPARRKPKAPQWDPTTQYARDVQSGAILAGRAVRQACARHLRDLERQRTPEFPYFFDVKSAQHIIDFFPTFLTLENGAPFVLPAWLQFSYGCIFGWKRLDGMRKFQYGFFETSKGSGKSPSAGGVGLYCQTFDGEAYGEIYSAAFDKGQASIILNDAIRMASDSPDLSEMLEIGKYNIANLENGSFFRAVSSEHRGKSGPRPSVVLGDEIHEHRDGRVINKLTAGFKGRPQPLALLYTNSGSDKASICWEYHQKSLAVLEGSQVDEQWFAYVCHLDPCEVCYTDGYRQPRDGCKDCDDWTDPNVWLKVAPALGVVIQPKYMQDAVDMALSIPSEYSLKRRLNFCIWTETHQIWIGSDAIDACKVQALSTGPAPCAAGFDMSDKLDLTACVIVRKVNDAPGTKADSAIITDNIDGKEIIRTLNLNFIVELIPYFWIPEDTMRERIKTERLPFDAWERAGWIRVTPGPIVDHDLIYEEFTKGIYPKYKPFAVGYDQSHATQFGAALRDKAKLNALEVAQGRKLSEAYKLFEALVHARRIRHLGNPVMSWCIANCEAKYDRYRNLWVEKPANRSKRIDGAVAGAIGLQLLMTMPAPPPPPKITILGAR